MRTVYRMLALALALLLVAVPALAASVAVVTNARTPVHRAASDSSQSVIAPEGLSMSLTGYADGWGRVRLDGNTGYVRMQYLDLKKPVRAYLTRNATLYEGAGTKALATLPAGTAVSFLGISGAYARVTDSSGARRGYVALGALTSRQPGKAVTTSAKIERTIQVAQALMGRPYALVANPPASFNCAAFVYYCYGSAEKGSVGKRLRDQVHGGSHPKIASLGALKRGDMVCFNFDDAKDIYGHVGIYLGGGRFIHASSSDDRVTVSSLASGYYREAFSWGRRIFH